MSKFLARLLCVVMLINAVLSMSFYTAYAADDSSFSFEWNKTQVLDDSLNLTERGSSYDKALFWWNYGISNGLSFDDGEYTLSYHISDGKRVDVTVTKKASVTTVKYKVWDYTQNAYIGIDDTVYQVYRPATGAFVTPNSKNFPATNSTYCVNYDADGNPTEVSFNIIANTGFSFKFDNRNVQFKWVSGTSGNLFYYVTDGMKAGNVYDVNLDLNVKGSSDTTSKSLQIFTGIDTDTFTSTPYANDRTGDKTNPIDHTTRPLGNNPGYEPELVLSFDMPKVWDDTTNKFDYPDKSTMTDKDKTSVIIDLSNDSDKKKIQLNVDNIYASDLDSVTSIATSSGATVKGYTEGNRVCLNVKNLEAGTIYNPVEISLYKPNNASFLSDSTELALGKVYTYPEFSVVSTASDQFYIKIEPYVGYSGFYTVKQGLTAETLKEWAQYEDKTDGSASIYLPVDLNAINNKTRFFSVEFEITPPDNTPGQTAIKTTSQILKYTPDETDVVLGTPNNLEVTDLTIVQNPTTDEKEMHLSLRWDVAYTEVLKNLVNRSGGSLDVTYIFNKGDVPYDENEEQFAKVNLNFTLDGDKLVLKMTDDDGKLEDYSLTEKTQMVGEDEYTTAIANATFVLPVSSVEENKTQFTYPNVYFINTKAEYKIGNTKYTTGASLPVDITLDDIVDLELPQPQNFKVVDNSVKNTSFKLSWRALTSGTTSSDLYNYNKSMLETLGLSIGEKSLKYNIYIAQNKTDIDNLINYDSKRDSMPDDLKNKIKSYDYGDKTPDNGLNLTTAKDADGNDLRTLLRNGNIIKIENVLQSDSTTQQLELTGLDKNQKYYVTAETVLLPYNETTESYVEDNLDHSNYCKVDSATTLKDNESPDDNENDPAAPSKFDKDEVKVSSAKLIWNNVHEVADPASSSKLEYQFIRIVGQQMDKSMLDSKLTYAQTWEKLPSNVEKVGWRTDEDNTYEYTGTAFSTTPNSKDKFLYDNSNYTQSTIVDNTLSQNQLYFYYIRTVRVVEGTDVAYSVWVPLTLTTTPVEGPYDLAIDKSLNYDKESAVGITFKLPKIDMEKLGTDFDLQYSLKEDNQGWSDDMTMTPSDVTYEEADDGTIICHYVIKKLNHGVGYKIRVRLYDKNLNSASLYSNTVSHRTNLNQDDYDNDHDKKKWEDHYIDLINDIIKKPYWLLEDTSVVTTAIYRPDPFKGILAGATEGVVDLTNGSYDGSKKTYYIPGSAIEEAYNANKGFRVKYGDMEVIFGPKSIDPSYNDSIVDIKDKIKTKDISDYFVKITVDFSNITYEVNGETPISPMAKITVETVGSKKNLNIWDDEMITKLLDEALDEDDLEELEEDLKDLIKDDELSEEFVKTIKDAISSYMKDFEKTLDKELDKIARKNFVSLTLASNVIITYPVEQGTTVKGNRELNGTWVSQEVKDYGTRKAMYTLLPGTYVFTGSKLVIPGISNQPNGTIITNLVAKFGLDDYLGKGSINTGAALTRTAALGCVARISGAAKTDDPTNFLKAKGVNVVGRSSQVNITTQEAVYFTMMAYQIRTNTKIDTIQIRNYTLTAGIQGLANSYKKAVQAAYETGIYTKANMNPNGTITVKDFLDMLAALAQKAKLV